MTCGLTRNTYTQTSSPTRLHIPAPQAVDLVQPEELWAAPSARVTAAVSRLGNSSLREHTGPVLELVLSRDVIFNLGHRQGNGSITHLSYAEGFVGRGG